MTTDDRHDLITEELCRHFLLTSRALLTQDAYPQILNVMKKNWRALGLGSFANCLNKLMELPVEHREIMVDSLSLGQVESKLWLCRTLKDVLPWGRHTYLVVGGWTGILGSLLLWFLQERVQMVRLIDKDPLAATLAKNFNRYFAAAQCLQSICRDAYIHHEQYELSDVIINCSCEHFADLMSWRRLIPRGKVVVCQSNNYFTGRDHINCVTSTRELIKQLDLDFTLFEGHLTFPKYERYMVIGVA